LSQHHWHGGERGLVFDAGRGLQQARDLLGAEDDRQLAGLVDEGQMPGRRGPIERHAEKEPQRRDRIVDRWRADVGRVQVQLEKTQVFGRGRRSAKEARQGLDRADLIALRL
jgi:hypothetical protein